LGQRRAKNDKARALRYRAAFAIGIASPHDREIRHAALSAQR
jgi:hypothetical protein